MNTVYLLMVALTNAGEEAEEELATESFRENKEKQPLSFIESQMNASKAHSTVELLSSLSNAVEKSASQKFEVKTKGIDARKKK